MWNSENVRSMHGQMEEKQGVQNEELQGWILMMYHDWCRIVELQGIDLKSQVGVQSF